MSDGLRQRDRRSSDARGRELVVTGSPTGSASTGWRRPGDPALADLVGLALRRNPQRAHLLVSTVLGKHSRPTRAPSTAAGLRLGAAGRGPCSATPTDRALVLGFAETATGLGHCVAEALGARRYLHSTRRAVARRRPVGRFEEEHSHATGHLLLPDDPGCSPAAARWCSSTTSCPPAAPR